MAMKNFTIYFKFFLPPKTFTIYFKMGLTEVLTVVFIVLKLTGVIAWPWLLILSPTLTMIALHCILIILNGSIENS